MMDQGYCDIQDDEEEAREETRLIQLHPNIECRSAKTSPLSRDDWGTPQWFYDLLFDEFEFELDACANEKNAKHWNYYSLDERGEDALLLPWAKRTFDNCPYSKTAKFLKKAFFEAIHGNLSVHPIAARPGTIYWHELVADVASEIRFVKGRLHFDDAKDPAPFDSAVVIFDPENLQPVGGPKHVYWDCRPKKEKTSKRKNKDI